MSNETDRDEVIVGASVRNGDTERQEEQLLLEADLDLQARRLLGHPLEEVLYLRVVLL